MCAVSLNVTNQTSLQQMRDFAEAAQGDGVKIRSRTDDQGGVTHNSSNKSPNLFDRITGRSKANRETTIATLGKFFDDADKASGDKTGKVRDVFAGVSKSLGHDTGGAISAIKLSTLTFAAQGGTQTLVAPETRDNSAPTGPGMDSMNG